MAKNALDAAEATGALLAFPGNVYVYGRAHTNPVREDHPMDPHTTKGRIRLDIERSYLEAHRTGRARVVIPRYPDFYGPNVDNELFRPIFDGALDGRPCRWPVNADVLHEFILIDDAAAAMLKLIETPAAHGRAVHVPGPRPITAREFIRLAYDAEGHSLQLRVYRRGMIRLAGLFNREIRATVEMLYLFEDPLLLDGSLYRSLTHSPHPSTPYPDGLRRTLLWRRTHRANAAG
jgi:nucleoside-diphosphate-sugar epimerase